MLESILHFRYFVSLLVSRWNCFRFFIWNNFGIFQWFVVEQWLFCFLSLCFRNKLFIPIQHLSQLFQSVIIALFKIRILFLLHFSCLKMLLLFFQNLLKELFVFCVQRQLTYIQGRSHFSCGFEALLCLIGVIILISFWEGKDNFDEIV